MNNRPKRRKVILRCRRTVKTKHLSQLNFWTGLTFHKLPGTHRRVRRNQFTTTEITSSTSGFPFLGNRISTVRRRVIPDKNKMGLKRIISRRGEFLNRTFEQELNEEIRRLRNRDWEVKLTTVPAPLSP